MKKLTVMLLLLMMVLVLAAGCGNDSKGPEGTADDPIVIRYFTFSPGESHEKDLQAMIAAFEKDNPGIKIEYEMASYDDYFTKLQTQIAGSNAPDVFELNYENFVSYAAKGALLELDPLIKADKDFDSSVVNAEAYDAFKYDGKQYGMVESFSNVVLFYNKDLFDAKGVAYPAADWTWEEELVAAQALTDRDAGIWGTYSPIQFWEFYKTIAQNGGSIFNDDVTEVTINSPQNVETLQWMVDKIYKYEVSPSDKDMSGQSDGDLFKDGKIAMLRTGIWMFDYFSDASFEWDIALEPGNTEKAHHFFSNGLAISKDTEYADAAWKWVKFMSTSEEATSIRVDAAWELPAVTDESVLETYLQQSPPASRHVVFEALDFLIVPPVIERQSEMTDIVNNELDRVKLGQVSAEEALANLEVKLAELIK